MTTAPSRTRGKPATTGATGPSISWRLFASSWLVIIILGSGGFAWVGFGLLAWIGRRRAWLIAAMVYAAAAVAALAPEGAVGHVAQGALLLVTFLHGLIINQSWMLLLWGRHENGLTIFGRPPRAPRSSGHGSSRAAAIPKEAEKLLGGDGTSRSDYVDDTAPAPARRRRTRAQRRADEKAAARATSPTRAAAAAAPVAAPVAEADLVDVNTANQRALARLTGMDRALAKRVVAERSTRGGFSTLEDFAATAGLQPHQLVRLRGEAFCSARPRAPRSFGRRVDY